MTEILGSIWWLLVALGLLITFHEFGHFWVARKLGVRVLKFSIGFGRTLWSRRGADGVEYVVALLPLGGYVKMLDERESDVPESEAHTAFNRKSVWTRIAIVGAGPVFNLVFAVAAFWVMFMVGIPEVRPLIGEVKGPAAAAGIEAGDEIISLDGNPTRTWTHTQLGLVTRALDGDEVNVVVQDARGTQSEHMLDLSQLEDGFDETKTLEHAGIIPWRLHIPAVVNEVMPESAADRAGLRSGDRIVSIAGEEVNGWGWIGHLIQQHGAADQALPLVIERNGFEMDIEITPGKEKSGLFSNRLVLGITRLEPDEEQMANWDRASVTLRFGPIEGLGRAVSETWRLSTVTLGMLGRMVTGQASVKNLSGPISIARFANSAANAGLSNFLFFLGAISLSLGVLILLPIPVLDGGHLLYYLIELAKGSPVSESTQIAGQYFGLVALAGLMSIAFVNDILRLVG
jgi:regulator of sigma E protease